MKLSRVRVVFSLVLFALPMSATLVAGCASQDTAGDIANTGDANVGVATQAASTADVTKVTLTVSGPGIPTAIVKDLKFVNGQWAGKLSGIPVGSDRVFLAEAYDATNTILYTGGASGVTITKGETTSVALVLQQKTPPNPFANGAPQISSLVASAAEAAPGAPVALAVTATDPDNDALTYAWTATGGSLANAATATPIWTAPLTDGTQTLSVSVTDGNGGQAGMSVQLKTNSKGSAEVSTTFNNWPVVTQVAAAPGQLQPGDSSILTVTATDVDGDALTYAWSDNCGGSFSSTLADAPTWTAPATTPSGGTCTLTVSVSDGRGGAASGELLIGVNLPDANLPPVIDQYFQSADAVSATEQVNLWVSASDPEGAAVSFTWAASGGTLGTATDTASSSELMWTAPSTSGTYSVTATVTDASGLTTTLPFAVDVLCVSDSDCSSGYSCDSESHCVPDCGSGDTANLVSYWTFEDASGTTVTDSRGANSGSIYGSSTWTPSGKVGWGLSNVSGGGVSIVDDPSLRITGDITLEAWVYRTAGGNGMEAIINRADPAYYMYRRSYALDANAEFEIGVGNDDYPVWAGREETPFGQWLYLVGVYDGSSNPSGGLRLYLNGALVRFEAKTGNMRTSGDHVRIGQYSVINQYFVGTIDEVAIYDRALSANEVAAHYQRSSTGSHYCR